MITFAILVISTFAIFTILIRKVTKGSAIAAIINSIVLLMLVAEMVVQQGNGREWVFYLPLTIYHALPMYGVIYLFHVLQPVQPEMK